MGTTATQCLGETEGLGLSVAKQAGRKQFARVFGRTLAFAKPGKFVIGAWRLFLSDNFADKAILLQTACIKLQKLSQRGLHGAQGKKFLSLPSGKPVLHYLYAYFMLKAQYCIKVCAGNKILWFPVVNKHLEMKSEAA